MAGRIPDETLQAIRDRVSLVEVVSSYVQLKKAGRNFLGLCPFHSEKTPSFTVNEERGLFHCFGCGEGGTVFNFVMRVERVGFPEAVEQLAGRAGITLASRDEADPNAALREQMFAANRAASDFFAETLRGPQGAAARVYLKERGLRAETIEKYGIGFAPASGAALTAWLNRRGVASEPAVQLGLVGRRDDGSFYDRFRGRVMFPIRDRRDRILGFGGRILGPDQPKYLNSPESLVFRKGEGLYGLGEARDAIRKAERVVLVEGYTDVLLLVQEGIPYAVGVLGTALTTAQLKLLRPFGGDQLTVFFFFDGDAAGRKAALRAFGVCAEADLWGRAVFLEEGHDPDSFVRSRGAEATLALLDAAPPLADFYFDAAAKPGATLPERARAADEVARILARVRNDLRFELLVRQAASRLGVGEEVFRRARGGFAPERSPAEAPDRPLPPAEALLLEAMVGDREVAFWVEESGVLDRFGDAGLAAVGRRIVGTWREGGDVRALIESLPPAVAGRLTRGVVGEVGRDAERRRVAEDCVARIEQRAGLERRRAIVAEVRRAESSGDVTRSRESIASLNDMIRRGGGAA